MAFSLGQFFGAPVIGEYADGMAEKKPGDERLFHVYRTCFKRLEHADPQFDLLFIGTSHHRDFCQQHVDLSKLHKRFKRE